MPRAENTGYSIDGGFAEYTSGVRPLRRQVPRGIDPFDAARLTCAGVTTYKAVKVAGAALPTSSPSSASAASATWRSSTPRSRGLRVVAVDLIEEKLEAREGSAPSPWSTRREESGAAIQALGVPIRRSRSPCRRRRSSRRTARFGGRHARLRRPPGRNRIQLPIFETVLNGITIVGSIVGTGSTCVRCSSCTRPG